ncbi:hypothetical protein TERTU_4714 [Teredinibacter turnerae T7901]|uniref:DUF6795 domain-containing protein n=1 Tax=Teredinibacter turnerae (strain ATCC 39867 / T7901) TaxID=377629 RepID=C5BKJ3_TERTT|nr:DUF6795 domain-containing protein [Teredinibacter turnerae]ACR10962.1 hypothetical protein TERTU_4714 [Teredinibacter turnerae T7901]
MRTPLQRDRLCYSSKILRRLRWNSNEDGVEQAFYSDENGYFDLPAHEETLEIPALVQFVAKTDLYAIVDGERDQFWFSSKMDKGIDSEFERRPAVWCLNSQMT